MPARFLEKEDQKMDDHVEDYDREPTDREYFHDFIDADEWDDFPELYE